jgi:hypothetical protein
MDLKEVWLIDYARTAFSRSRGKQPERDVFGEIRGDELLAELLMKFFDGKLADKGIQKGDINEVSVGVAAGVLENWSYSLFSGISRYRSIFLFRSTMWFSRIRNAHWDNGINDRQ